MYIIRIIMIALRGVLSGICFSFTMSVGLVVIILGMVSFAPVHMQKVVCKWLVVLHDKLDPLMPFFQDKEYFGNVLLGFFGIFISLFLLCFYSYLIIKLTMQIIRCTARRLWYNAKHGEAREQSGGWARRNPAAHGCCCAMCKRAGQASPPP